MKTRLDPSKPTFIFEMANNHQGSLEHGCRIIREMGRIAQKHQIQAAVKLQYRDLDTFVHPDYVERDDVQHIPRFLSTRLSWEDFQTLVLEIKKNGMLSIVTPFDEKSIERCAEHCVDVLKIASCSANDWPLLEAIANAGKPIICSTGGLSVTDIDKVVTFFEHRGVDELSILHCVGIYPTENKDQHLSFMSRMISRYPGCCIGYSGHESPANLGPGMAAAAIGAKFFERHVGVPTESITLNKYSMNPEEADTWVGAVLEVIEIVDPAVIDKPITELETQSLLSLQRGVFAKGVINAGEEICRKDVYFAMPCKEGQMNTTKWAPGLRATSDYQKDEPIYEQRPHDPVRVMRSVVHEAKGFLREASIELGSEYRIELSHHYGMEKFRQVGAIIIDFFNREYCKKLIILLPGQQHPSHYHEKKEETFQILYGEMELILDGEVKAMKPGDFQLVKRRQTHSFRTKFGVVFEEISTTHLKGDSTYQDENIASLDPIQRKSVIEEW